MLSVQTPLSVGIQHNYRQRHTSAVSQTLTQLQMQRYPDGYEQKQAATRTMHSYRKGMHAGAVRDRM